jgi:hypothetical protein
MLYSDLPSTYYGVCTYVGFATHRRATVKILLYIKGLMFMNRLKKKKKKKKKKKTGRHIIDESKRSH